MMGPIQNTSQFLMLYAGMIQNRTQGRYMYPTQKTSPFLRLQAGRIQRRTRGQSMCPIWNTSLFLRVHVGTIRNTMQGQMLTNSGHLIVFKALRGDDPEQSARTIHAPKGAEEMVK